MNRLAGHSSIEFADEAALRALARSRLRADVPEELRKLAEAAAAQHGGVAGVRAVLAYGSTLRGASFSETLADLYVLTTDFAHVSANPLARLGCRVLPPNVYYLVLPYGNSQSEFPDRPPPRAPAQPPDSVRDQGAWAETWGGGAHPRASSREEMLRAKYAVLPLAQFQEWVQPGVDNPYFWARFSQPSRLVWAADEAAARAVENAVMDAIFTALTTAAILVKAPRPDWRTLWEALLSATYRTELRVERPGRARAIVKADAEWYRETVRGTFGAVDDIRFPDWLQTMRGGLNWNRVVAQGKVLSVLRLVKAAFTFSGGADYIAFKIERHTGERIALSDWQRRHPLIAGLMLLPRLLRKGIVR